MGSRRRVAAKRRVIRRAASSKTVSVCRTGTRRVTSGLCKPVTAAGGPDKHSGSTRFLRSEESGGVSCNVGADAKQQGAALLGGLFRSYNQRIRGRSPVRGGCSGKRRTPKSRERRRTAVEEVPLMTDKYTGRRLVVSKDGRSGPYLTVPVTQIDAVRHVLDQSGVRYWIDETAISVDGKPAMSVVNFGKLASPETIQATLDRAG
jgi:hypothetical protein